MNVCSHPSFLLYSLQGVTFPIARMWEALYKFLNKWILIKWRGQNDALSFSWLCRQSIMDPSHIKTTSNGIMLIMNFLFWRLTGGFVRPHGCKWSWSFVILCIFVPIVFMLVSMILLSTLYPVLSQHAAQPFASKWSVALIVTGVSLRFTLHAKWNCSFLFLNNAWIESSVGFDCQYKSATPLSEIWTSQAKLSTY